MCLRDGKEKTGYEAPREMSVSNLFNVGDSVKPPEIYGVGACADSAMDVTQKIREAMGK